MKITTLIVALIIAFSCPVFGYEFYVEDFSEGLPLYWSTQDNLGGIGGPWVDDNPGERTGFLNLTAPFMIADSAFYSLLPFEAVLITPMIDCSNWENVYLLFGSEYNDLSLDDYASIEASGDGGTSWTTISTYFSSYPDQVDITDISAIADGSDSVILKFVYGTNGEVSQGWWAVDNVILDGDPIGNFLYMFPGYQEATAVIGEDITYYVDLYNQTGGWASIDLSYSGNNWFTEGSDHVEMGNQETQSLWTTVTIPITADHGQVDTVTLEASSGAFSTSVTIATTGVYYWNELTSLPTGRGDGAASIDGTNVFFIGGTADNGTPGGEVDIYDTDSASWSAGTTMATPLTNIAAESVDGKIYVPGGYNGASSVATNLIYDVSGNSWSTGTDAPDAYAGYALVTDGTDLYRIGGTSDAQWGMGMVDFDKYDVSENSWSSLADMPAGRVWAMAEYIDGKIYVAGGLDASGSASEALDIYDIASNTWNSAKATLPGSWWGGASAVFCDYFFIFGGVLDGAATEKTFYYDPSESTWTEVAFLNDPRFRLSGTGNDDIGLFALGGWNPLWTAHDTFETYKRCLCGCYIDDTCLENGTINPENVCEFCDISQSQLEWSDNNGEACDDELWCNGSDTCQDGTCSSHEYETGNPRCPDDTLYCNGEEFCDEDNDQCTATAEPCADDGLWCNGFEGCDEDNDLCTTTGDPCPDDELFCTGVEGCDEGNDQCTATGDPCPDDGQWCNGEEFCDEDNDICDADNVPDCPDDSVFCNGDEICDEEKDECSHSGDPCTDDGMYCNGEESCDEDNDQCVSSGSPCPADDQFCNGAEGCDEENDECTHAGDPCDPGEECNELTDVCAPLPDDDDDDDIDDDDNDSADDDTDEGESEKKEGNEGGCTCG